MLQKADVILAEVKHQRKNIKSRCSHPNCRYHLLHLARISYSKKQDIDKSFLNHCAILMLEHSDNSYNLENKIK